MNMAYLTHPIFFKAGWFESFINGVNLQAAIITSTLLLTVSGGVAFAAEGGSSFYLPGQRGQGAGMLPPVEGLFASAPNYFYSGDFSETKSLEIGGSLATGIDADIFLSMPTVIWVTPVDILGGDLAFSGTALVGHIDINAESTINIPGLGTGVAGLTDDRWAVGDPVMTAMLGWKTGNLHYTANVAVNVPIGDYEVGRLANTSLNRWVTDLTAAATWLNPDTGMEISAAVGVSFNGENSETQYETGEELHLEAALTRHFSPQFSMGLNLYHYDQISGDSGAGAVLGKFKGRVTAIGPSMSANFQVGKVPVTASFRYLHEFNVKNRLEGDNGWLTITIPLWVPNQGTQ